MYNSASSASTSEYSAANGSGGGRGQSMGPEAPTCRHSAAWAEVGAAAERLRGGETAHAHQGPQMGERVGTARGSAAVPARPFSIFARGPDTKRYRCAVVQSSCAVAAGNHSLSRAVPPCRCLAAFAQLLVTGRGTYGTPCTHVYLAVATCCARLLPCIAQSVRPLNTQ